ncbi:ATP-binding cassette domain-containing protein [Bordetella sp. FB-8]|uniref:branched-chain amino acid ABC transporter ATP-binding protein/permease n=1 Tax=Bordetella sp. FB-8 TaxID=1159870 RepID=UPI00037C0BF7|nr:ATP-binding cassette domain-containing protein [Bordetella sp. FB-8]
MASSRAADFAVQAPLAVILLAVPRLFGDYYAYQIGLYLLYGIATQGVALCWGQAGFLSLGQAVFFGTGAYLSGLILRAATQHASWLALLPLCLLTPALLAYIVGRLVFARRVDSGPYFSLITLALAMLATVLANSWSGMTGGFNGLTGIPDLPGTDRYATLYYVIAAGAIAWTALFSWLRHKPLGVLWTALAQNEDRLQFFGFATDRLKACAFAVSAAAAGFAGALYAPQEGIVTPDAIGILLSTQFVIWAAVGGRHSPVGSQLGALSIGLLSAALRDRYPFWEALTALVFIGSVLWLPNGLAGAAAALGSGLTRPKRACRGPDIAAPLPAYRCDPIPGAPKLVFDQVHVKRGPVAILDGLALHIAKRGITCLIGPNGAGKTSIFNALTGRLAPSLGSITLDAHEISRHKAWQVARLGIGRKFQIPSVFMTLTVEQNLLVALWANRLGAAAYLDRRPLRWATPLKHALLGRLPMLRAYQHAPAATLSQGARQMLEFVMVALMEPRLFLLDEPCAGLSPGETHQLLGTIIWVVDQLDASALLIEHDMSAVEAINGQILVLHQGRLLAEGPLTHIKASEQVRAVYAGGRK